ncbi:spore maturation protein SpmA [Conyzicola nivalis]|uniref:Spore maturation protein SpmA n=1 Tax=Conyzicola nivalis TaxID=1477021 RepID=A0ABV2QIN6_9MICO
MNSRTLEETGTLDASRTAVTRGILVLLVVAVAVTALGVSTLALAAQADIAETGSSVLLPLLLALLTVAIGGAMSLFSLARRRAA